MPSWPSRIATRRCALRLCALLTMTSPATAHAAWHEWPNRNEVIRFADDVDSVAVWSIALPDSAAVGKGHGVEVLNVARVRDRVMESRRWGRAFAAALFANGRPDDRCDCDLVRNRDDTAEVIVPVAEFYVKGESMWVPMVFRDSCAGVFLDQGRWKGVPLRDNREALLHLIREALPLDSAFVHDSWAPRMRRPARSESTHVEELPEAIEKVPPPYPDEARRQNIFGTVIVVALVGKDGTVKETRIDWSIPYLDEPAVAAVRRWRFKPARVDGRPIAVWVAVPVRFHLD